MNTHKVRLNVESDEEVEEEEEEEGEPGEMQGTSIFPAFQELITGKEKSFPIHPIDLTEPDILSCESLQGERDKIRRSENEKRD